MVDPSTDGVYILLHEYVVHWRTNDLIQDYVICIDTNLSMGDYTGDIVYVNKEQEGTEHGSLWDS